MTAQVKTTGLLARTKQPSKDSNIQVPARSKTPTEPASQASSLVPHSAAQLAKSNKYHADTVEPANKRAVDGLNPTTAMPAHRMFPGLAN